MAQGWLCPSTWQNPSRRHKEARLTFLYSDTVQVLQEICPVLLVPRQCKDVRHQGCGVGVLQCFVASQGCFEAGQAIFNHWILERTKVKDKCLETQDLVFFKSRRGTNISSSIILNGPKLKINSLSNCWLNEKMLWCHVFVIYILKWIAK